MNSLETAHPLHDAATLKSEASRAALLPILVADDDEDDLFFTVRLLRKVGTPHPIVTFNDGIGLREYLSRKWLSRAMPADDRPRLLFLDLKMRGLGGFAFLEWIRDLPALEELNVVVLSGSDEPKDVECARKLGARRYLAKHPSLPVLTTIVNSAHTGEMVHAGEHEDAFFFARSDDWRARSEDHLRHRR